MKMITEAELKQEIKKPTVKNFHNGSIQKFIKTQNISRIDNYINKVNSELSRPITTKAFIYERDFFLK